MNEALAAKHMNENIVWTLELARFLALLEKFRFRKT